MTCQNSDVAPLVEREWPDATHQVLVGIEKVLVILWVVVQCAEDVIEWPRVRRWLILQCRYMRHSTSSISHNVASCFLEV